MGFCEGMWGNGLCVVRSGDIIWNWSARRDQWQTRRFEFPRKTGQTAKLGRRGGGERHLGEIGKGRLLKLL